MKGMAYVDGEYVAPEEAKISVFATGLIHSEAVYDSVSVWDNQFFKLERHLDRFERSCAGFHLINPVGRDDLQRILAECVDRSGLDRAMVRMHVYRGPSAQMSPDLTDSGDGFYAHATPYTLLWSEETCRAGVNLHIASVQRISAEAINPHYKNFQWGDFVQGQRQAHEQGCDDTLLCAADGSLAEGPGYNIFVVRDGRVATPEHNCLEGITRETAIELCELEGVPIEVRSVNRQEIQDADEAFITSSRGGIVPVIRVNSTPLGNGAPGLTTTRLSESYWARRAEGWHTTSVADILAS